MAVAMSTMGMPVGHWRNHQDNNFFKEEQKKESKTAKKLSKRIVHTYTIMLIQSFDIFNKLWEKVKKASGQEDTWNATIDGKFKIK